MQKNLYIVRWRQRRGSVLLLGLLVLVIVGMLFWYKRMHGPVYQICKGKSDIAVPWRQWHDIHVRTQKGHPPGKPAEQQAQIPKTLQIVAEPNEDGRQRGQLTLMIRPQRRRIILRSTTFVQRNAPVRFVCNTVCQSSSDIRIKRPSRAMPALFTSMSTAPSSAST